MSHTQPNVTGNLPAMVKRLMLNDNGLRVKLSLKEIESHLSTPIGKVRGEGNCGRATDLWKESGAKPT